LNSKGTKNIAVDIGLCFLALCLSWWFKSKNEFPTLHPKDILHLVSTFLLISTVFGSLIHLRSENLNVIHLSALKLILFITFYESFELTSILNNDMMTCWFVVNLPLKSDKKEKM